MRGIRTMPVLELRTSASRRLAGLTAFVALIAGAFIASSASAQAAYDCGSLQNSFGPFDYRYARRADREVVERHHFDAGVESLKRGITDYRIAHDIDYTLRVFPNHIRALWAMSRLGAREKSDQPAGARYTVDCYFDRAIRFQPEDPRVRLVYGLHLVRKGEREAAVRELDKAAQFGAGQPDLHYNLGLAFFDLKDYERSLAEAKLAYGAGFPLPGLRDKLKGVGQWRD